MDTFDPAYSFNMFRLDDAVTDEVDFVVKLGGSAITVKDVNETLKLDALCSAADVLARCFAEGLRFIVAHGAG
jgi:isopentenyl phosphate kinase